MCDCMSEDSLLKEVGEFDLTLDEEDIALRGTEEELLGRQVGLSTCSNSMMIRLEL